MSGCCEHCQAHTDQLEALTRIIDSMVGWVATQQAWTTEVEQARHQPAASTQTGTPLYRCDGCGIMSYDLAGHVCEELPR